MGTAAGTTTEAHNKLVGTAQGGAAMKEKTRDVIRTIVPIESDFDEETYRPGLLGDVVESSSEPRESYAVDLAIPDAELVGGYRYANVVLDPGQFVVVMRYVEDEELAKAKAH
jgi:hypothetical protein